MRCGSWVKRARSGSEKRRRRNLEWFRTDDAEHAALTEKRRASGLSLGAFVMRLAAIESGQDARARRRPHVQRDIAVLLQARVAFNRASNNLDQLVHAVNRLVLEASDCSSQQIVARVQIICQAIEKIRADFAAPLAAIIRAISHDR